MGIKRSNVNYVINYCLDPLRSIHKTATSECKQNDMAYASCGWNHKSLNQPAGGPESRGPAFLQPGFLSLDFSNQMTPTI